MASLLSLMNDVYVITNRDDLVAETKLAVKMATLKMHQLDDFPKDIVETGIAWTPAAYIQSLDYKAIIPTWRRFKYLRKYADGLAGDFFKYLSPEETLDRYNVNKENICYLAGTQIEIRSNTQDDYMLVAAYASPDITDTGFSSWIADEHPYAIICDAAASVFKQIGFDEQASYMKQTVAEQIAILRQSNIL